MQLLHETLMEPAPGCEETTAQAKAEYALHVTMLYQDATTLEWAMVKLNRVMQLAGCESLRVASWKISELSWPSMFSAAVQAGVGADVVVAAVSATEELPPELGAWFDAWLPRRTRRHSALVGLLSVPEGYQATRPLDYLRAVARKGGLDFFSERMSYWA